jgi:hypothetical protein
MKRNTSTKRVLEARRWAIGSAVVLLLLLSAGGLALLAQQAREQANVVTVLLALYLASWSYVLGIVGLVLLPVLELIGWFRVRMKRAAMSRYSPAEPRSRRLEKPALRDPQYPQRGMASTVPSRSSGASADGNETNSLTRVA